MKPDDFEKRLQREPLRQIPTGWRAQILGEAKIATRNAKPETRNGFLAALLWPNRLAWAGLAAVWGVIFALEFASHNNSQAVATASASQPATFLVDWRAQQQMLVELMGNNVSGDVDRSRSASPKPRSERRITIVVV